MICQRCSKEAKTFIMSMFNTQMICMDCKDEETRHPRYREACDAELEAAKRGDYNFQGIGLD